MPAQAQTDLVVIRQFITSLDAFARHDSQWDRIFVNRHAGGFGVVSPTFRGDVQAFSEQWHEEAAPMLKALEDDKQAMIQLAQRYRVSDGAFALLNPHKAEDRSAARAAAEQLANVVCVGAGDQRKPATKRRMTGRRTKDKPLTEKQKAAVNMLVTCGANKSEAAARLGISRAALDERLNGAKLRGELAANRSVRARRHLRLDKRGNPVV